MLAGTSLPSCCLQCSSLSEQDTIFPSASHMKMWLFELFATELSVMRRSQPLRSPSRLIAEAERTTSFALASRRCVVSSTR